MQSHDPSNDDWLRELLEEPEIDDDGFTDTVMARMDRLQYWRKISFITMVFLGLIGCFFFVDIDAISLSGVDIHLWQVVACLVSLSLFGIIWLDGETLEV